MFLKSLTVVLQRAVVVLLLAACDQKLDAAGAGQALKNPDFLKGDTVPAGATHDWNLGPTGARGWMYSQDMSTRGARQVYVTKVAKNSPSDGVLAPGDVILGIAGARFSSDPRVEIGRAITAAEARTGRLELTRWRKGDVSEVHVRTPMLGAYSNTAPFDCQKSLRIFEQGCEALARKMQDKRYRANPIERSLNILALLSSGNRKYLPILREQVQVASKYSDRTRRDFHSWWYGYTNIAVAEYVLATGDKSVMPDLRRMTVEIVRGQSAVGSWGHKFVQSGNGQLSGYGMMNSPGVPLTISLVLAQEAGVDSPEVAVAIKKSARLLRFYVDKGSIPYGDHTPWLNTHDDNGKNGMAAVLFNLLGDEYATEYFSRMSVASHGAERDAGHTGNFFNVLWAMPGVALSGPHASGEWMKEFGWYYDLARQWDGAFPHQGQPMAGPDKYRGWDCTGAYLLAYGLPLRSLHLTGKQRLTAPQVDPATAKSLIDDGRPAHWSPPRNAPSELAESRVLEGLSSWSPVVRDRSAKRLARLEGNLTPTLIDMLKDESLYARYGACRAMASLKRRAAPAVPALIATLDQEDLWLRIEAANALTAIGSPAQPAIPRLIELLGEQDPQTDPRGMQQRYLALALFTTGKGLLQKSLEGYDQEGFYQAVQAGLSNEDGYARARVATIYKNLTLAQIRPLLPAIVQAIEQPAPSGIMFADQSRLIGLEVLAKHGIEEGVMLCVNLLEPERWGARKRIRKCLAILRVYGGAARPALPALEALERQLKAKGWKAKDIQQVKLAETINAIKSDKKPRTLIPLEAAT